MKTIFTNYNKMSLVNIFLLSFLFFANTLSSIAQVTATEDFENETAANTGAVFSESGANFNTTFRLVTYPGNFGYNNSPKFLEISNPSGVNTSSVTISINTATNPGVGFRINSFAGYTSNSTGGTSPYAGIVTIKGTPVGGGALLTANINVASAGAVPVGQTREANFMVNGLSLAGTPLAGLYFTTLTFTIFDTNLNDGLIGTGYLGIDHINFTTEAPIVNNYAIGNASITEGNAGTSVLTYNVNRSINTLAGSVQVQSSNGTATAGSDYVAFPLTTVNFTAGGPLTQSVNVTINGDVGIEPNETINMALSNPVGGTISSGTGVVTITDDDQYWEIFDDEVHNSTTFSQNGINFQTNGNLDVNVGGSFGAGGSPGYSASKEPFATGNQGSFVITAPGKSFYITSVDLWSATVSGGPSPNWTYTPTNCTVTFTGVKFDGTGNLTHTAAIAPTGTNGHFTVNFAGSPLANVNLSAISFSVPSPITYLQIDNFKYGVSGSSATQVSINDVSVLEGTGGGASNIATFTVTRTANNTGFSVDLTSSNGSATAGVDYTAYPTTTLNFTNGGALSQTVTVPILKDASIEVNEIFNLTLTNASNGTLYLKQVGVGTILDDDKICETFDTDVNNATTFSENGIAFSSTNRFRVSQSGNPNGLGSGNSPGFLIATNGAVGSMGKMMLTPTNKAFKISSIDAWVSTDGTNGTSGSVKFIGTLFGGGGFVETTKAVAPNSVGGWNQNILFTGTPLDNVLLTELEVISLSPITEVDIDNFCYAIFNTVPIIEVADAGNVPVTNGGAASTSNNTDFGTACVTGGTISKTFTVKNTGAVNLVLPAAPNIILGGADASHFNVTSHSGTTIPAGGSSSFIVVFDPTSAGLKNATLTINSNDATNNPFVINIKGTGTADPVFTTTTNNGLKFDGQNDYVVANYCSAQPIITGGNAITVEYWFKGSNIQSAVRTQDSDNDYMVAGWSFPPKHILSNDDGTSGGVAVGSAATDGNWHHVAFTWQQSTTNGFKSYLDGELVQQRNSSNNPLPNISNPLYLGAFQGSSEFMNGTLDNVRIWNVARNQAQIRAGMCNLTLPQTGLVVFYAFDQGAANATNTGINLLENKASQSNFAGVLNNFSLTGSSSNWVQGVIPNTLASGPVTVIQDASTNPIFIDANCNALGKVEPIGGSAVTGNITFKSWVETDPGFLLVRRHMEINPSVNATTATANITLNFTQADFDFYNTNTGSADPKLPQNPTDTQGLTNLRLFKISGISTPSDGRPNNYDGDPVDISGSIISKTWNGQFWEIKFSTVGFSGFFVNASLTGPLPVNLISFTGKSTENGNLLNWKTASEKDFSHFEVEKSSPLAPGGGIANGKFEKIGQVDGSSSETYEYLEAPQPQQGAIASAYYRLKIVDLDGSYNYSKIIFIENNSEKNSVGNFYPNPAVNQSFIEITALEKGNWNISSFDLTGKLINSETRTLQKGLNKVSIEKLMQGVNFVRFESNQISEIRKVIKE